MPDCLGSQDGGSEEFRQLSRWPFDPKGFLLQAASQVSCFLKQYSCVWSHWSPCADLWPLKMLRRGNEGMLGGAVCSLALFSCDDFIAANGNGSHVFAIIPHIVIMRQSRKAHTHTLSRVRAHSTKLFIKPYGFVFSLYIGRGSSLKENNKREYLKGSYHAFLIVFFSTGPLMMFVKFYALKTIILVCNFAFFTFFCDP